MKIKAYQAPIQDIKEGIVTIAFARFDVPDKVDDIIRKGAFAKTFKEQGNRIKHVTDHEWKVSSIVGAPLRLWETSKYAMAESAIAVGTRKGNDVYELYKHFANIGAMIEHSFAYQTIKTNVNNNIRGEEITELKMNEYATVFMGCQSDTPFTDVKSADERNNLINELNILLRKADLSDEAGMRVEEIINELKGYSKEDKPKPLVITEPSLSEFENLLKSTLKF